VLELKSLRNDRDDYARTCAAWLFELRRRREDAIASVGEGTFLRYERFLEAAVKGFQLEIFQLLRLRFSRFDPS
jgi:cyclopropane-fatty-acyl-phospholipid synthase